MENDVKAMPPEDVSDGVPAKIVISTNDVHRPKEIFRDIASPACSDVSEINMFADEDGLKGFKGGSYDLERPRTPGTPNIPEVLGDHWASLANSGEITEVDAKEEALNGDGTWAHQDASKSPAQQEHWKGDLVSGDLKVTDKSIVAQDVEVCEISDSEVFIKECTGDKKKPK
mmetsp:Transcript_1919/g.2139  ORF Transcript_1919/g.2139 Transcript_1919/m.2139 type:complete len:172 (-) Transcript_1919:1528-2043(-)|eukprot:CAMPEP_0197867810 /NCGR_PEP_ID=MMETSP1438-20131217/44949_1 /TAXON_ID=1461541 /ORGANISM="Pterosperma sp., Strain CCMP1384" /LENGTH=171 /DNA_ID=CAMNT_0043486473 /DNA_START=927 /DNA_END=1442 /DNA_ORIENTATION=+